MIFALEKMAFDRVSSFMRNFTAKENAQNIVAEEKSIMNAVDDVANINIKGALVKDLSFWGWLLGGETCYKDIAAAIDSANADTNISKIDLIIDSPGGTVAGVDDAAIAILMSKKPVRAVVDGMCCSAAYWLASQASEIVAKSELSRIGSIGVAVDYYHDENIISLSSTESPDKRPDLSTEAGAAVIRKELDAIHAQFVNDIAAGRNTTAEKVNADFGRGAVFLAGEAKSRGMIDAVIDKKKSKKTGVTSAAATTAENKKDEGIFIMDRVQFKSENPTAYAEIVAEGAAAERERITALQSISAADEGNEKLASVVNDAIASGKSSSDIFAQVQVAIRDGASSGKLDEENAPEFSSAQHEALSMDDEIKARMQGVK